MREGGRAQLAAKQERQGERDVRKRVRELGPALRRKTMRSSYLM